MSTLREYVSKFAYAIRYPLAAAEHLRTLRRESELQLLLEGSSAAARVKALGPRMPLRDTEFRVYSQFGDDGIIQYLVQQVAIPCDTFIEFGVEDYTEANTRFLLINDNWRGLIIDGDAANIEAVRKRPEHWRHDLRAVSAFITCENINSLILDAKISGAIGILSVDIDGNDYWIWEAIRVVDPAIVIAEYNSAFGLRRAVSVPYDPNFQRAQAHYSHLYFGCSLRALCFLAERKGYVFVGCSSNGNNAYFVKRTLAANLIELSPEAGYVPSRYRESRDRSGRLTFVRPEERRDVIADEMVVDVERNETVRIRDLDD